jgi:hypothetical protein
LFWFVNHVENQITKSQNIRKRKIKVSPIKQKRKKVESIRVVAAVAILVQPLTEYKRLNKHIQARVYACTAYIHAK